MPPEDPIFANRATADRAIACFTDLVAKLHSGTLKLRPANHTVRQPSCPPAANPNTGGTSPP